MDIKRYWSCDFTDDNSKTFEEYVDECDKVVHESVAAHRIADVKVGSFLSGGVDSSYIAACLMPDTTYSVGFDYKNFNETNYAAELSDKLGIKNVRKMITADEFFDALPDIQYHMDEPQSNLSSVPLYYLAQMASKEVTVVLSGEVDEVLKPAYDTGKNAAEMCAEYYKQVPNCCELSKKQYLDMNMWLPGDILLKADKMCMAHSLELRVPFLDKKVMEFAEHIPANYRVNEEGCKLVLRHAANRTLPDEWATRKKVGFPVPVKFWLREQKYYDYVKEYFTAPWAADFFDTDALMKLLDDHFKGRALNQRKIYTTLTFLIWYKRFFIDENKGTEVAA